MVVFPSFSLWTGLGWPLDYHLVWMLNGILHIGLLVLSTLLPRAINEKVPEPASAGTSSAAVHKQIELVF